VTAEALISIKPRFAEAILSGSKTVELRRRIPSLSLNTRLWIYATRPVAAVVGSAIVERIERGCPEKMWAAYGQRTHVSYEDYLHYFGGSAEAVCLFLVNIERRAPVSIDQLKRIRKGFHPPQVMNKLSAEEASSIATASKTTT
jgi:predicted transcriptional regulator